MDGLTIEYTASGAPDGGVDIAISPQLQASLKDIIRTNCQTLDDQCIQSVTSLLTSPTTELHIRQLAAIVIAYEILALGFSAFVAILYAAKGKSAPVDQLPAQMHVASSQYSQVTAATAASVTVVSVNNVQPFTITPKPVATGLLGYVRSDGSHLMPALRLNS